MTNYKSKSLISGKSIAIHKNKPFGAKGDKRMTLTEQFYEEFQINAIDHNGNFTYKYVEWLEEKIELFFET